MSVRLSVCNVCLFGCLQVDDGEYFNPDYVEVDRVLEMSITQEGEGQVTYYLVKWCALPYEDSTWELEQDVPRPKIDAFLKFRDPPPEEDRQVCVLLQCLATQREMQHYVQQREMQHYVQYKN